MSRSWLAVLLLLWASGCTSVEERYATPHGQSLNGISQLISALRGAGLAVQVIPSLPLTSEAPTDVVILFEDQAACMEDDAQILLDSFACDSGASVVLRVLRDTDVSVTYWEEIEQQLRTRPNERAKADAAAALALEARLQSRSHALTQYDCDAFGWYSAEPRSDGAEEVLTSVNALSVRAAADDLPVEQAFEVRWPVARRLLPAVDVDWLWSSGDDGLLICSQSEGSPYDQWALSSAYPLLNGGQLLPGHRDLMADLIARIAAIGQRVTIITSTRIGSDADEGNLMWRFAKIFPHPWIIGHLVAGLMLYCWSRWQIFGRPRSEEIDDRQRFGRHIEAVAELLATSTDDTYAQQQLDHWQRLHHKRAT